MAPPAPTKELRCIHCTKAFGRVEHLKRHEITHSGDKPYRCSVCSKAFVRRDALQRHEQTHRSTPNLLQKGARACGHCASAKARCSGEEQACERCRERKLQCTYPEILNPQTPLYQSTAAASPQYEANVTAFQGYTTQPQVTPGFGSSNGAAIFTSTMSSAAPAQQADMLSSPDFWDPNILSTTNWLDALDCDFDGFAFPGDPYQAVNGTLPSVSPSQAQKQPLPATAGSPGVARVGISSAPAASSTAPSEDYGDGVPGEFYVDGQNARLPRVKRRRTSTATNAPSHGVPAHGFLLEYRPFDAPGQVDDLQISDEMYAQIIMQYQQLCLQSSPLWSEFQQQSASLNKKHLEQLLCLYWKHFQPILPFLHSSWATPNDHRTAVAMCAIGSQFAEQSIQFVDSMHEFVRRQLLSESETPLQRSSEDCRALATLLLFIARTWSGTETTAAANHDLAEGFKLACRRYDIAKVSCEKPTMTWKAWCDREAALRLAYTVWLLDAMVASHQHTKPLLNLADATLPLPCTERLWEADSEGEWQALCKSEPHSPSLQEALQQLFIDKRMPRERGEFARILIIHGIYHWLWDVERHLSNPLSAWEPTAKRQSSLEVLPKQPVWLPSVPAFARWQNSACDALDILHWQANATIGQASGLEHPGVCHLHFARVVLLAPGAHIVRLARSIVSSGGDGGTAGLDKQYVQRWAVQHQYKARLAAIHAGVLFWHIRRYSADAFYEGPVIAQAALLLWAFGTFAQSAGSRSRVRSAESQSYQHAPNGQAEMATLDDEPASSIILLDRPTDDELVQQFIRRGHTMQAHITGVGDLFADQGPCRVLLMACKLLASLKCWGASASWQVLLQQLANKVEPPSATNIASN